MAELGKIEKPDAASFSGKRKLYCIPAFYPAEEAPDEYKALFENYWDEVGQHLDKLEAAGMVKRVFCENIHLQADEALDMLSKINGRAFEIVRKKVEAGAFIVPVEKSEILGPFLDWSNCLHVVRTDEVFRKVLGFYTELAEQRIQHIIDTIDGNLSESEAGLLIIQDEDRVKLRLPEDIEIFLVAPPAYDNLTKWIKGRLREVTV